MTAPERAPLGAALALLLALVSLTGALSPILMSAAVAAMAVLIGIAWPALLELPSATGTRIVVAGTGVVGALVTAIAPERIAPLSGLVMVCAIGVFGAFVHQMLRRHRRELTASLTGTVAGVLVAGISTCWAIAQASAAADGGSAVLTAIAAGLAAVLLLNAVPVPVLPRLAVAVLVGAAVTTAMAAVLAGIALPVAAGIGLVSAIGGGSAHLLVGSSLTARDAVPSLAVGAVPVATVGVVAHLALALPL